MTTPREPAWKDAFGDLWAGTMEGLRLDLPFHRAVIVVRTMDDKAVSWYEVAFEGITRFEFTDRHADVWTSTELTEAYRRAADNSTQFTLTLAHINNALSITCQDSRVTLIKREEDPLTVRAARDLER